MQTTTSSYSIFWWAKRRAGTLRHCLPVPPRSGEKASARRAVRPRESAGGRVEGALCSPVRRARCTHEAGRHVETRRAHITSTERPTALLTRDSPLLDIDRRSREKNAISEGWPRPNANATAGPSQPGGPATGCRAAGGRAPRISGRGEPKGPVLQRCTGTVRELAACLNYALQQKKPCRPHGVTRHYRPGDGRAQCRSQEEPLQH